MQLTLGLFQPTGSARRYVRRACATVLSLVGGVLSASAQTPALQADWIQSPINGHWYGVDYTPRTWTDSESLAVSLGGHLATIRSQAEQDWIEVNLAPYMPGDGLLLGLNDAALEGTFVWASGESVPFTNWATGQPDNAWGGEDYVHMFGASAPSVTWKWNDLQNVQLGLLPLIELPAKPQVGWSWPIRRYGALGPYFGCLADLDGDGDLDYVSTVHGLVNPGSSLEININDGSGQFMAGPTIQLGVSRPHHVVAVDHDQDGDLDLVVTIFQDSELLLLENDGSLGFTVKPPLLAASQVTTPNPVISMHADSDGVLDLVVGDHTGNKIRIGFGQVGGGFSFAPLVTVGTSPRFLASGDIDADGDIDVAVSNRDSNSVWILKNDGAGSFSKDSELAFTLPGGVSLGDIDGDLYLDLCVTSETGEVKLWTNDGVGSFTESVGSPYLVNNALLTNALGDFDLDGDLDIVVAPRGATSNTLTVFWNDGLGMYPVTSSLSNHDDPFDVLVGDLNGDGSPDVLGSNTDKGFTAHLSNFSNPDCNGNGIPDYTDLSAGTSLDCNANGIPDECEIASGASMDCNVNGIPDSCELLSGTALDCNANGIPDECDIASGFSTDFDADGQLDECVTPPLYADTFEMSLASGGTQSFSLITPPLASAVSLYVLLGTISGTTPGVPVGSFTVPLNPDAYLNRTFNFPSTPPLGNSVGVMSPASSGGGQASATFSLPPAFAPTLVGLTVHHAFVSVDLQTGGLNFVSNAVPLHLLP